MNECIVLLCLAFWMLLTNFSGWFKTALCVGQKCVFLQTSEARELFWWLRACIFAEELRLRAYLLHSLIEV